MQERLEGVWKLAEEIGPLEGNLEARLRRAGARQPFGVRVKHDKIVPTHKGWQICPVVDSIEAQTKALHGNTTYRPYAKCTFPHLSRFAELKASMNKMQMNRMHGVLQGFVPRCDVPL